MIQRCPKCGGDGILQYDSSNVAKITARTATNVGLTSVASALIPVIGPALAGAQIVSSLASLKDIKKPMFVCENCGYKWEDEPQHSTDGMTAEDIVGMFEDIVDGNSEMATKAKKESLMGIEPCSALQAYDVMKDLLALNKRTKDDDVSKRISTLYDIYIKGFIDIDSCDRELIMIVDSLEQIPYKSLKGKVKFILAKNNPETFGVQFYDGRFLTNEVYICHPYEDVYVRYSTHEEELFKDEMEALQIFLAKLGAKRISIVEDKNSTRGSAEDRRTNIDGAVSIKGVNAKGSYEKQNANNLYEEIRESINIDSEFPLPAGKMEISKAIGWAKNRTWQNLAKLRIETGILKRKHTFSMASVRMMDESTRTNVEAELSYLINSISGGVKKCHKEHHNKTNEHTFTLEIEFYPLDNPSL